MTATLRRCGLAALLLAVSGLVANAAAEAKTSQIRDDAGFFSKGTVESAQSRLADVHERYKVRTVIETFPTVPDGQAETVRAMTGPKKEAYFSDLARRNALLADTPEVYVLISKDPTHLRVRTSPAIRQRGFSDSEGRRLTSVLMAGFRKKSYDSALLSAVETLESQARSLNSAQNRTSGAPVVQPNKGTGPSLLTWALIIGGGFLVMVLISSLFRSATAPGYGGAGYGAGGLGGGGFGGGGGGFFGNLLGTMGGVMAGHWLYDNFFGSHSNSAHANDSTTGMHDTGADHNTYESGDYGGDYGDSGGDFGGGDFGGGDFGGGDGGGDF